MSKSIRAKVRSQQAYNAEKIGNKPGLPPKLENRYIHFYY